VRGSSSYPIKGKSKMTWVMPGQTAVLVGQKQIKGIPRDLAKKIHQRSWGADVFDE
jgi:hypothetical protein